MSRAKRGTKTYLNYYNGVEKIVSDNEYQSRFSITNIDNEVKKIFNNSSLNINRVHLHNSSSDFVYKISINYDKIIYLCVYFFKNSGQATSRKRLQIYPNYFGFINDSKSRKENEDYFYLGLYPINNEGEFIYVLLDNDGVSLNPQVSYSSLWVDYEALKATILNGFYFGINKNNANKYFCFRNDYKQIVIDAIKNEDYSSIIKNHKDFHFVDKDNKEIDESEIYVDDYNPARDAVVTIDGKAKIKKNAALREIAFFDANYTCDLCDKNTTFITNSDKMYFEAHHLIPCNINIQKKFKKKLDHALNLFCLCPECHRKIHLIKNSEVEELLKKLFIKRKNHLNKEYNIELNGLLDIYKGIDRKDEENM